VTVVASAAALVALFATLGPPVGRWLGIGANPAAAWAMLAIALAALVVVRVPRVAHAVTRLLVPPPREAVERPHVFRGLRPYGPDDVAEFFGRSADAQACWERLQLKSFFILEGESGCGKSSLLEAILLPRAQERFHVVSCRCADDPFGRLRCALLDEPYERSRRYGRPALKEALDAADRLHPDTPVLVCIDQFEELFVTVPDKARGAFLEAVTDAVARGRLRLLLGIRSDFSDLLLKACRDADPERRALDFDRESYYTLLPFNAEKAESVVNRMLGRDERLRLDPVTVEERNGFTRELVQELLRPPGDARLCGEDEKRVLPVELQMVGSTYETVVGERFTALELKKRGGKVGLYRDYIADAKDYVFRKTGVGGDTALAVLRRLISPAGTKWAQSAGAIAAACGGLSAKEVDEVLRAFADRYLARRLPDEQTGEAADRVANTRYELMHEHMVQLLCEAPEPGLQKLRDAEARLRFWCERTRHLHEGVSGQVETRAGWWRRTWSSLRSLYRSPIPAGEVWGLWRFANDSESRRMLRRSLRGHLAWPITCLVLLAGLVTAREMRERSPSYQVEYLIRNAPLEVVDRESSGEANTAFEAYFLALGATGDFARALREAQRVVNPEYRAWACAAVARAAGATTQFDQAKAAIAAALAAIAQVEGVSSDGPAFRAVCEAAAETGQIEAVLNKVEGDLVLEQALLEDEEPFGFVSTDGLLVVAKAAARSGLAETAREALVTALEGRQSEEPYASSQVQAIAVAAADASVFDIAMESAALVNDKDRRTGSYKQVAECAARAGQIDLALDAASRIANPYFLPETYKLSAEAAANAGRFDVAFNLASQIAEPFIRSQAYLAIAGSALGKQLVPQASKAIDAALLAAEAIEGEQDQVRSSRANAFVTVAEAATHAKLPKEAAGAIRAAADSARRIGDSYYKDPMNVWIARAAARAGRWDSALVDAAFQAAARVSESYDRARAYVAIVEATEGATSSDTARSAIDLALRSAEQVFIPVNHYDVYESLATAARKAGMIQHLIEASRRVPRPYSQAQACAAAAEAAVGARLESQARALFDSAMAKAEVEPAARGTTSSEQIRAHAAIVRAAVAAGMIDVAMQAVAKIPDSADEKSPAKASIARALARAGRYYDARVLCGSCERIDKLGVYTEILRGFSKRQL
jgi:hypothetical protein